MKINKILLAITITMIALATYLALASPDNTTVTQPTQVSQDEASQIPIIEESAPTTVEPTTEEPTTEEPTTTHDHGTSYHMYYTNNDAVMVAKLVYGEAGSSWISYEEKACVVWTVCNRVDDPRYEDTIAEVILAPGQFHGYNANNPVTEECYRVAVDVLTRWSLEKHGLPMERELPKGYTMFYGDGYANHFYKG